jgi:hypothetical protein
VEERHEYTENRRLNVDTDIVVDRLLAHDINAGR